VATGRRVAVGRTIACVSTAATPFARQPGTRSRAARTAGRRVVRGLVAVPALPILLLAAAIARTGTRRQRRRGLLPRLVWGPEPIVSIKYWSLALRARGFVSQTCVWGHFAINQREDFDRHFDAFLPRAAAFDPLRAYAVFLWSIRASDIYMSFFDGGFLRGTALRRLELPLLRLAGKSVIVSPYGADIAVPGHLGIAEERLLADYPSMALNGARVRRRVLAFSRWADLIVRNLQYGFLPRWDVVWPTMVALDTDDWRSPDPPSEHDGESGEVVIVHAPNHRQIKGTDELIAAVGHLRSGGLRVRLELLEGRPNREVRAAVLRADIVAEQFVAGYGLFAIEGMSAGRPVLSALSWLEADLLANLEGRGCPIVDTNLDSLEAHLQALITDPARRRDIGASSRKFAVEQHSYDAAGRSWEAIIRHVWNGDPLPAELRRRPAERAA
jgi:glycosyltransferase involved in cell wall biosynthesis